MTNQERQDYQFYDQNQMKEEMQNQNQIQKQGKKGGYSKNYKEQSQRGNQNINNLEDKTQSQNVSEYNNNYQIFRKHKKGYTNYQGKNQNEEFDNRQRTNSPQGYKKPKRKRKEIMKDEFMFDNQQNNHPQMYNKQHKKNQINTQQQRTKEINNNNINYNNNINTNNNNVNNNNNYIQNINNNNSNEQFKQNINLNPNNLNNQNFNFQNQQNQNKQNINKNQNMLLNSIPNQNILYINSIKQNETDKKDEKSTETTTDDLSQSSYTNINRMIEPQENRHINLGNTNMNQYFSNDMLMNKNYIQQQNFNRMPTNMYNNMPIPIEQNQLFNNMNNQQNNLPFGVNEDAMKHKKINKKIQKSPNEGNMVNMNPNMNIGNMMNIPNLHFSGQNMNNNKYFKNNNNLSLNNKGSLSMQGNKNTIPNFNPNLNLNFIIPQKSPQAPQNTIPQNIINPNLNLNMSQRNFYNNPNNNINKRHQNPYKRVNSDKNILGIENKNKVELYNHNMQNKNFPKFHNNINNNNLQNPNLQQQKMFQSKNEEWIKNLQNQQIYNMNNSNNINNQLKKNFSNSLHIIIKLDKTREEILDLRPGEEPKNLINSLKEYNLDESLKNLIYQKIMNALKFNKYIFDLVPSKYTLKQMNLIKNCLIEKKKNTKTTKFEPFIQRNASFIDNLNQFENYISEIKPSYDDIKNTDILNITQ